MSAFFLGAKAGPVDRDERAHAAHDAEREHGDRQRDVKRDERGTRAAWATFFGGGGGGRRLGGLATAFASARLSADTPSPHTFSLYN